MAAQRLFYPALLFSVPDCTLPWLWLFLHFLCPVLLWQLILQEFVLKPSEQVRLSKKIKQKFLKVQAMHNRTYSIYLIEFKIIKIR